MSGGKKDWEAAAKGLYHENMMMRRVLRVFKRDIRAYQHITTEHEGYRLLRTTMQWVDKEPDLGDYSG